LQVYRGFGTFLIHENFGLLMQKNTLTTLLGVLLVFFGFFGVFLHLREGVWYHLFWFSNHWMLLLGIGFLFYSKYPLQSNFIISYSLVLGIVPELFWNIDFLYRFLIGIDLFGITTYWFVGQKTPVYYLGLQHFITPIIAFSGTYYTGGIHRKAWLGAIMHGIGLSLIGFLFSSELNINCAWKSCMLELPISGVVWVMLFPFVMIAIIFGTYVILEKVFKKMKQNAEHKN